MSTPRPAADIMVTRLVTLGPDVPVIEGIARLLKSNITGAPVHDSTRSFLGVFSEKCCLNVLSLAVDHADEVHSSAPQCRARDFMARKLLTLRPEMDVFDAIGLLLKNRISGAPVVDEAGKFLGVFSEKTSMKVVIESAYAQLPTAEVGAFMNDDPHRTIDEQTDLPTIVHLFLSTPYRRLVVLRGNRAVGQISRRDALRAGFPLLGKLAASEQEAAAIPADHRDSLADCPTTAPLAAFMDRNARTVDEDMDLVSLANIFLQTNYRRLPVLRDRRLVGQISRRDLLKAAHQMMAVAPSTRESNLLYLSSLTPREEAPIA